MIFAEPKVEPIQKWEQDQCDTSRAHAALPRTKGMFAHLQRLPHPETVTCTEGSPGTCPGASILMTGTRLD